MPTYHPLLTSLDTIRSRLIELPLKMRAEWLIDLLEKEEHRELLAALCQKEPSFRAKLAQSEKDGLTILLSRKLLVLPDEYMRPILTIQEMLAESQVALAKKQRRAEPTRASLLPATDDVGGSVTTINHWSKARSIVNTFYPISRMPTLLTPREKMARNPMVATSARSPHSAISLFSPRRSSHETGTTYDKQARIAHEIGRIHRAEIVPGAGLPYETEVTEEISLEHSMPSSEVELELYKVSRLKEVAQLKEAFEADLELHHASGLREEITTHDHKRNMEELVEYAIQKTLNLKTYLATHNFHTKESVIAAIQYAFETRTYFHLNKSEMRIVLANIGVTRSEIIEAGITPVRDRSAKVGKGKRISKKSELITKAEGAVEDDLVKKEERVTESGTLKGAEALVKRKSKKRVQKEKLFKLSPLVKDDEEDTSSANEEPATVRGAGAPVDDGETEVLVKRKGKKRAQRESLSKLGPAVDDDGEDTSIVKDEPATGGGSRASEDDEAEILVETKKRAKKEAKSVLSKEIDDDEAPIEKREELLLFSIPIIQKAVTKLRSNELLANSDPFRVLIGLITGINDENIKVRIELLLDDCAKMNLLNVVSHWNSAKVGIEKESKNDWGFTPLIYAAKYCKNPEVIQLLMDKNPDNIHRMIKDKHNETFNGKTAVEIAIQFKNVVFLKVYSARMEALTSASPPAECIVPLFV